jgi:hypothetical protein
MTVEPTTMYTYEGLTRNMKDHLPVKPTWRVIFIGVLYALFGALLALVVISALVQPESIHILGWVITGLFALGALAGFYSAYDELRHINQARALDREAVEESVKVIDNWSDRYLDGGVANRKLVHHLLYLYAGGQHYAKHSVPRSVAETFKTGSYIRVKYLKDNPTVFRPVLGE